MRRRFQYWIWLLLIILLAVGLSWASLNWRSYADLSSHSRNSLGDQLSGALQSMQGPLKFAATINENPGLKHKLEKAIDLLKISKADISLDLEPAIANNSLNNSPAKLTLTFQDRSETIYSLDQQTLLRALLSLQGEEERWIVFLSGHGEKAPDAKTPQGYSALEKQLLKQGYRSITVNLASTPEIPANTSVLVIAGVREEMTAAELDKIKQYAASGGNLLWAVEPDPSSQLHQLADSLSVSIAPGTIINLNQDLHQLLGLSHPAEIPVTEYAQHQALRGLTRHSLFPVSASIVAVDSPEWQSDTLFESISDSWTEFGDLSGHIAFNAEEGELSGPLSLGVALTRKIENTEQRVCVIGDSDFLSNRYLSYGGNSELATALFGWLSDNSALVNKSGKTTLATSLDITDKQLTTISIIILLGLPGLCLILALLMWWRIKRG